MARSSEFGGDASAVAANTPTPAPAPASSLDAALTASLAQLSDFNKSATALIAQDQAAATGTASNKSIIDLGTAAAADYKAVMTPVDPMLKLQQDAQNAARIDALSLLQDTFTAYGLTELIPTIKGFMTGNVGAGEATLLLKQTDAYKQRFAGNITRVANGQNALSETDYLSLENQYTDLMSQYGVKNLATRTQFATLIGNDVSASELNSRLDLAVNKVQNADPQVLATLKSYYPTVSNSDLASYFLAPGETLPQLQQQTLAAQIGTYATEQLTPGATTPEISQARAMQIAQSGVTESQAKTGYETIGVELPIASKLATIYGASGINYDQTAAEAEQFGLTGAASAARAKQRLQELEKAQFSGRSGVAGASAAAGYTGSLGKSIQGKF